MTLSSRHRIRNSSPGDLRLSTLPLGHGGSHNTDFHTWMGKKHFCFFQNAETGNRTPNSGVKGSGAKPLSKGPRPHWFTTNSHSRVSRPYTEATRSSEAERLFVMPEVSGSHPHRISHSWSCGIASGCWTRLYSQSLPLSRDWTSPAFNPLTAGTAYIRVFTFY